MGFKDIARSVAGGSFIAEGRQKVKLDDFAGSNNGVLTIIAADLWNGDNGAYCACVASEDEKVYFTGGKALTEIVTEWAKMYDGDCKAMSADLTKEGGVSMEFEKITTKAGRTFTQVTVVDKTGE